MNSPTWRPVREATAVASAPALVRPGQSGDGDEDDAPCPVCGGSGIHDGAVCTSCNGSGSVMREAASAPDTTECPLCDGTGKLRGAECPRCHGTGKVPATQAKEGTVCSVCFSAECDLTGVERMSEAVLNAKQRKALDKSDFAIPEKGPGSGSYPIPDEAHAHAALSLVAQHGTPQEQSRVRRAVKNKFPKIEVGGTKESGGSLLERLERLEETSIVFQQLREAKPASMTPTFSTPTRVRSSRGQEGYRVVLIREGKGNADDDQWYTISSIQEMCESGVCEGMQAYADHPDAEEEENRPERSVRQLVGYYHDVRYVAESGPPRAEAVFVPLTTDENHPHYGWIVTLAEAAVRNSTPQPLCGISLYGLSAGDDRDRPDGSYGRMVDIVRPASGDIVTNAGAGGGFVRQLMESARALRQRSREEHSPMQATALQGKIREAVQRVREADSDEARLAALNALGELETAKLDNAIGSVEELTEAAPNLVKELREAATAEAGKTEAELREQLTAAQNKLGEAEGALSKIGAVRTIAEGVRAAGITDDVQLQHYVGRARERRLSEADDVKAFVEADLEYQKAQEAATLEKIKESLGLSEDGEVEGAGILRFPTPVSADASLSALREAGIPLKDAS